MSTGAEAKRTRRDISCVRLHLPRSGDRSAILAAAAPVLQARRLVRR
ncbi:MAG TPA: hypothetical protein VMT79_17040 [Candidatus Binatia bacterium]|nr:hypothetical protein [Candidatus Binatia bacterium]